MQNQGFSKSQNELFKLKELVKSLSLQVQEKDQIINNKDQFIEQLKEALLLAKAKRFGFSAESYLDIDNPQISLFDEAEVSLDDTEESQDTVVSTYTRNKNKGKRKSLPDYLPREIVEHRLSEDDLTLDNGLKYEEIGTIESEQLEIIPADVKVIKHVRYKYAVKAHEEHGVLVAPIIGQVIPKSVASNGLLAHIAQSKYAYHLPLYRQQEIWKDLEVDLSRASMSRWMVQLGEMVQPVVDEILEQIKLQPYVQVDETTVRVLDNPSKSGKGYMWVYHNKSVGCVFQYKEDRSGLNALEVLEDYQGYVQSDDFSGYSRVCTPGSDRISVGCWAHARRKFIDVTKALSKKGSRGHVHEFIELINKLYTIEAKARSDGRTPDQLYEIRQIKSVPILEKIKAKLDDVVLRTPPKGLLGKAIGYTLDNWPQLNNYTKAGYLPIDNNNIENKIRPFAVGRKNWLFSGSEKGAQSSANLFTLVENAKMFNLKIFDYLKYVFDHIATAKTDKDYEALTPMYAQQFVAKVDKNKTKK
jgi:transposase